ncbi:amidohydrolase [Aerococcus urinaehominis]|uniref:Amidohydrolase n=1 Tax=Aerococcus urinaehominis TaxID=128944 RepID=A0A109RGC3_9LACT|nr:M20 family metallopeptidase [Aerococcus urinaehominis]AMB98738.1 amidohydrolase [Aerococcus urinaehominis]SDM63134.1 amidohydrolase [Aerococcus urinaehominis]
MAYLDRARELFDDAVKVRRTLHENPEVGFELPETTKLVKAKLDEFGIAYENVGNTYGITGALGDASKGKTVLVRADMDALAIQEKSKSVCTSKNDNGHLCGHDMHTTILLMVLKMLKENEDQLQGQVKFLFQPAEETLNGGKVIIEEGLFKDGKPDAGFALHMWPNGDKVDVEIARNEVLASALNFQIVVKGVGAHGAMPNNGVDPVFVASQIINAANGILARELPSNQGASLSMGKFEAPGGAVNVIPDKVVLEGTSRSLYPESAKHMAKRLPEIVEHIGKAFRAETEFTVMANCPALVNTAEEADLVKTAAEEALGDDYEVKNIGPYLASEDYAHIASQLDKTCYFFVGCPLPDENGQVYPVHHPYVQFNEEALIVGSATMATAVEKWLAEHK